MLSDSSSPFRFYCIADGKSIIANFTILADNPVTIDPKKIKDIAVWGTVQEGRVLPVKRTEAAQRGSIESNSGYAAIVAPPTAASSPDAEFCQLAGAGFVELLSRHLHHDAEQ